VAKAARVGARYLASKSVNSAINYEAQAKNLVVFGNIAGSGSAVLPGLTTENVLVEYIGGPSGVPELVKVSIVNYQHQSIINPGAMLNLTAFSTNVDVKPSVTMRYLLTQPSV
jgi:hypothetical protein